jgi:Fur family ferric uptake transcriptional regulator
MSAEDILRQHKLRITQFRVDVIKIFTDSGRALSSSDVEAFLPDTDRITLYRTLKSFEDKGVIHKALDGTLTQKYAMCDAHCDEHHHHDEHIHFHCLKCENTFCMDHVFIPTVVLPQGFTASHTDMVVNGVCGKCGIKN